MLINTNSNYLKNKYSKRVQKIAVNAGFTCPNRDGSKGTGGCIFCNNEAFIPFYASQNLSVNQQIEKGIEFFSQKYKAELFVIYFQAYSSTYKALEKLEKIISEINIPQIIGFTFATRPDCIDFEVINFLKKLNLNYEVNIELGIETFNNKILNKINRGHRAEESVIALNLLNNYKIRTSAHFILGLPEESDASIISNADVISKFEVESIKLHQFQVIKNTRAEEIYNENKQNFELFTLNSYMELVIKFLEKLNPTIVVERFLSEVPSKYLVAPKWGGIRGSEFLNLIKTEMEKKNTFQGKRYGK